MPLQSIELLNVGTKYSRKELQVTFDIPQGLMSTGVLAVPGDTSIWLFVTEIPTSDRTQYVNLLDGDVLYWQGQTQGRTDNSIIHHRDNAKHLLLFYRKQKQQYADYAFLYEGEFEYCQHSGSRPTNFVLTRVNPLIDTPEASLIDVMQLDYVSQVEGGKRLYVTARVERNPKVRADAIALHGTTCQVCGFNFGSFYGEIGDDYIHVHHKHLLSNAIEPREVDIATDLAVVCANCHAMIHRRGGEPVPVEVVKELISLNRS